MQSDSLYIKDTIFLDESEFPLTQGVTHEHTNSPEYIAIPDGPRCMIHIYDYSGKRVSSIGGEEVHQKHGLDHTCPAMPSIFGDTLVAFYRERRTMAFYDIPTGNFITKVQLQYDGVLANSVNVMVPAYYTNSALKQGAFFLPTFRYITEHDTPDTPKRKAKQKQANKMRAIHSFERNGSPHSSFGEIPSLYIEGGYSTGYFGLYYPVMHRQKLYIHYPLHETTHVYSLEGNLLYTINQRGQHMNYDHLKGRFRNGQRFDNDSYRGMALDAASVDEVIYYHIAAFRKKIGGEPVATILKVNVSSKTWSEHLIKPDYQKLFPYALNGNLYALKYLHTGNQEATCIITYAFESI